MENFEKTMNLLSKKDRSICRGQHIFYVGDHAYQVMHAKYKIIV